MKKTMVILGLWVFVASAMLITACGSGSKTGVSLNKITVTPANPTVVLGTGKQFTANGTYSDSTTKDITNEVTWGSSNTAVATIDTAGMAASLAVGQTSISATSSNITGSTTLTVTASASDDALLSNLTLSNGMLSTGFNSNTFNYSSSVESTIGWLTVTPTASGADATITVNGLAVVSGTPSQKITLYTGSNTITIIVTAEDGTTTKTYDVEVTKLSGNLFSYGFESSWSGWYADNGIWEVGTPTYGPSAAYSGTQCAGTVLGGNYPDLTSSRLISPSIVLPSLGAGEEIDLWFWQWFAIGGYDSAVVQIQTEASPGVWSAWTSLDTYAGSGGGVWTHGMVDLSAFADKKVHVGFLLNQDGFFQGVGPGWYIDDITIEVIQPTVLTASNGYSFGFEGSEGNWSAWNGSWQIGTPTYGPSGAYSGTQCAGTVLGGNYPDLTSSRLVSPSVVLPSITAGEEIDLRFWQWFAIGGYDSAVVQIQTETSPGVWSAWTSLDTYAGSGGGVWTHGMVDLSAFAEKKVHVGFLLNQDGFFQGVNAGWYIDDVTIEVTQPITVTANDSYSFGFEGGEGNWSAWNGSWQIGTPTYGPSGAHFGTECAGTVLGGNYPDLTSSRLVSPSVVLPSITAGEEIDLQFWQWFAIGGYDSAVVQIQTETSPGVWSPWAEIPPTGAISGSSGGIWSISQKDLSASAGKKVRIGFLLNQDGFFQGIGPGWYVDDIVIEIP